MNDKFFIEPKLSIILPARNEASGLKRCLERLKRVLPALGYPVETVVVDNQSADDTAAVARDFGAKVITAAGIGYGRALLAGFQASQGDWLLMADADDSYHLDEIAPFLEKLGEGAEVVIGNRYEGKIEKGAMPWLHRHLGTPVLTALTNAFFKAGIRDVNCGMRAMTREASNRMNLSCEGMEFAAEMVIETARRGLKAAQVPCNFYRHSPDRKPHLRPWRDAARHLRLILGKALGISGSRPCRFVDGGWAAWGILARHRRAAILLTFLFSLMISLFSAGLRGIPEPRIHDEFAYLLNADTFVHGRLSNPTHPLWPFFESFHVFHQPTMNAKYPPGQGLVLAMGSFVFGHPIAGVWLAMALFSAAVTWMFYFWTAPRWAVLGGLLTAIHFGFGSYWSRSYWGGALPALGGALVLGALARILKRHFVIRNTVLFCAGLILLANTRPYEGLAAAAFPGLWLLIFLAGQPDLRRKVLLPAVVVLTAAGFGMGSYNKAVTGDAFKLPYMAYEESYSTAPAFVWQSPKPDVPIDVPEMENFNEHYSLRWYQLRRNAFRAWKDFRAFFRIYYGRAFSFYLKPFLWIPAALGLLCLPWNRRLLFPVGGVLIPVVLAVAQIATFIQYHYFAPAASVLMLLCCEGLRRFSCLSSGPPEKRRRRYLVPGFLLLSLAVGAAGLYTPASSYAMPSRQAVIRKIQETAGKHLVLVRYAPDHYVHHEWVYNGAEIDAAPVVWARDLGMEKNREIMEYYRGRHVWILEADPRPPEAVHLREPLPVPERMSS